MASLTGRTFGTYQILDRIGHGGMASVYRAHDRRADREVAIKFISPTLAQDEKFLARFRREVKVVARLDHPNIVPVLDYGEQAGYAYLVMPLLEIGTLTDRLMERPLTLEEGGQLMDQISAALDYAHKQGVVHRDVKPSNILLDAEGNAMLADFGLARVHEHSISLTGSALIGTPAYMAPEQAQGDEVDARCDQYSLGVILYQLATGTLPFEADTPLAVVLKHVNEPLPSVRSRSPNVPEAVERVILKATAKRPDDRFHSVSEMNRLLQAALAHVRDPQSNPAPAIALPRANQVTLALPADKRTSRHPGTLRLVTGAALLLVLILGFPVFASSLLTFLERAASPAEGGLLVPEDQDLARLAGQVATIDAMSTELASSQERLMRAEEIQTAVIQTLVAAGEFDDPAAPLAATMPTDGSSTVLALPDTPRADSPPATSTPGPTPVHSPTPIPSSVASSAPGPSATPVPPTASPTLAPTTSTPPSATPTTNPTRTPTTPPTQDICSLLSLGSFTVSGGTVSWTLGNASSSTVSITRVVLGWPAANAELNKIRLAGSLIWNGKETASPTDINSGWKGVRTVDAGASKALAFEFKSPADPSGYSLDLYLDSGCQLGAGG